MSPSPNQNQHPKRLVIVESPTKAKTIRRFLPRRGYLVEASMGHVRDLPASAAEIPASLKGQPWARLGIKLDSFEPLYVIPGGKKKVVAQLKAALKEATELLIATDEDREGESIGWHLVQVLNPKVPVRRMVFHEITEEAIQAALNDTREIDQALVDAQETRRILDRLVGYTISPLLWKKIAPRLSAGRVQSVAVRLLVQREKARLAFIPASYWDLKAQLAKDDKPFEAVLTHLGGIRLATGRDFDDATGQLRSNLQAGRDIALLSEDEAKELAARAARQPWTVVNVEQQRSKRSPAAPFTTSTLQQEANRKLRLSAKETMRIAQSLYENGYITYMRTDSTHLSQEALTASRRVIRERYGAEYLSPAPRRYASKARNAQEAHEAIRPSGHEMKTKDEHGLRGLEAAIYDLIWKRTIASQMADAQLLLIAAQIEVDAGKVATFRASGRTTLFPGFFRAYVEGSDDPEAALEDREQPLPELRRGDRVTCRRAQAEGHQTKPPARYTEASLVGLLEQEGIGRPSTYAGIIDTVIKRGYVRKSGEQLTPTFTAFAATQLLEKQFEPLVDTGFTANMEQVLDDIAAGTVEPRPYLKEFYDGSHGIAARVDAGLEQLDGRELSTLRCAKWGDLVVRVGRYGPYVEGTINGERLTASLPDTLAPADVTEASLRDLLQQGKRGEAALGQDPDSGQPIYLRVGPYGPYLQLGGDEQADKPKRVSLPRGLAPDRVELATALKLLALPRRLGLHPETGEPVEAGIGRFGPYVKHGRTFASLTAQDDVLEVTLERALELLAKKRSKREPLRVLGSHPDSGEPVELWAGRYGPYLKHGSVNASLGNEAPERLTFEAALKLLAAKEWSGGALKPTSKGKRKAQAAKRVSKRAASKPKPSTAKVTKATPQQLAAHLSELDPQDAEVVKRLEGLGQAKQALPEVARSLRLSEAELERIRKRGMFKLRMAFGRARKASMVQAA
jgi:DNA topoisomerase-1